MFRILAVAGFLALGATAAQADDVPAATVAVTYSADQLASQAGRERLRTDAVAAADAYCRANPVEGTVAQCRAFLAAQADRQIEVKTREYAASHGIQLSEMRLEAPRRTR